MQLRRLGVVVRLSRLLVLNVDGRVRRTAPRIRTRHRGTWRLKQVIVVIVCVGPGAAKIMQVSEVEEPATFKLRVARLVLLGLAASTVVMVRYRR